LTNTCLATPGSDIPTDLSSQLRALKSGYFPGAAGYLPEMHRLSLYFNLTRANMEARKSSANHNAGK
jgi:hypothetical protein